MANEFKRMQKLAGIITESKYYESPMGEAEKSQKYPEGFSPFKTDKDDDEAYGGKVIAAYEAPMEGWDTEHYDSIVIVKKEDGYLLEYIKLQLDSKHNIYFKEKTNSCTYQISSEIIVNDLIK